MPLSGRPDPGGIFESDDHRRVLGHLPVPSDGPMAVYNPDHPRPHRVSLYHRMLPDASTNLDDEDLTAVLKDLEDEGYATEMKDGWRQTAAGAKALAAPVPEPDDG